MTNDPANPKRTRDAAPLPPSLVHETKTGKVKKTFDEAERVNRVFASQGKATSLAEHLSDDHRKRVAALCDSAGVVSKNAPAEFNKVLRELIDEQKAAVKGLEPKE